MQYSISDVAKMAGISTRTLRHYDEIGLLAPAAVAANGYRWYGRDELRRLQRILLLREMDVPLPEIGAILAGSVDETAALRRHLTLILAERDRLDQIATTINRTIADLEGHRRLPDVDFFRGLHQTRDSLAATLHERFGEEAVRALQHGISCMEGWARSDHDEMATTGDELYGRLSRARRAGVAPASPQALDLIAEHYEAVQAVWPVDPATYYDIGDLIETDVDQRAIVESVDPALPSWLGSAIKHFATHRLGLAP
ncbi:MAG: MerR family transcriptional regulator [Brachybacterium paraconglomeratum]|nr:MerR family transcriptional regulator [Brachybacterium paraconglomeratum]